MEIFLYYFSQKTGFDISWKLSHGDNLHEMSNPVFWKKKKKKKKKNRIWHFMQIVISMKCQVLFSGKNKKSITHLSLLN